MGEDAERFRRRARECRNLAAQTGDKLWHATLGELADELEEEAAKLDDEDVEGGREG
jgi:hypothetical protein